MLLHHSPNVLTSANYDAALSAKREGRFFVAMYCIWHGAERENLVYLRSSSQEGFAIAIRWRMLTFLPTGLQFLARERGKCRGYPCFARALRDGPTLQ